MLVYLDACCLSLPFDNPVNSRIADEIAAITVLVNDLRIGKWGLVDSEALHAELRRAKNQDMREFALSLLTESNIFIEDIDAARDRADEYERQGLKQYDAKHLSAAIESSADYLCTCDDRFLKKARTLDIGHLVVIDPLELFEELINE